MKPEAQRIAISEACGKCVHPISDWVHEGPDGDRTIECGKCGKYPYSGHPDYLTDLNAMREAEKTLTKEQIQTYKNRLCDLAPCSLSDTFGYWPVIHAIAAQRAEAFLRTIGKWTD